MPDHVPTEIDRIMEVAIMHNDRVDITGALLFSGTHFVQILEGSKEHVSDLMARIEQDPRHTDVNIIESNSRQRMFGPWAMTFPQPSRFIQSYIDDLLLLPSEKGKRYSATSRFLQLVHELVRTSDRVVNP